MTYVLPSRSRRPKRRGALSDGISYPLRRSGKLTPAGFRRALHDIAAVEATAQTMLTFFEKQERWGNLTPEEYTQWDGVRISLYRLEQEAAHIRRTRRLPAWFNKC
jgi:hypothetical protein